MARINKVGHVVLNVKDVEASVKFYTEALGMEVMRLREDSAAFLSFGTQHHDIALFKAPEDAEMGTLGLNHIAFQIEGGETELRQLYGRLVQHGATGRLHDRPRHDPQRLLLRPRRQPPGDFL